jgi:hypothetical protein
MRRGDRVPEIKMIIVGSPAGPGGQVGESLDAHVHTGGFDALGVLNAEFVEYYIKNNVTDNMPRVRLHGVSRGAQVAAATGRHLSDTLKSQTKILMDNPAGTQDSESNTAWGDGAKMVAGFGSEFVARTLFDPYSKKFPTHGPQFNAELQRRLGGLGVVEDSKAQERLKTKLVAAEGIRLLNGTPLDMGGLRSFVREELKDTASPSLDRVIRHMQNKQRVEDVARKIWAEEKRERSVPEIKYVSTGTGDKKTSITSTSHGFHIWSFQRFPQWQKTLSAIGS